MLLQDRALPNVVSLLTGEAVKGSWWAHPKAHEIFRCLMEVGESPDVMTTKLVAGKVTLVHRRLWPALLAVARSREPWQLAGLSKEGERLLRRVDREDSVVASGAPVKELERRLLVVAHEEHMESGAHKMCVKTWARWAAEVKCRTRLASSEGRRTLEKVVKGLGGQARMLPWQVI